jgi:hypothetical protein
LGICVGETTDDWTGVFNDDGVDIRGARLTGTIVVGPRRLRGDSVVKSGESTKIGDSVVPSKGVVEMAGCAKGNDACRKNAAINIE